MLGKSVEVDILRHLVERNMRDLRAVRQDKVDICALRLRDARFELLGDLLLGHPAVVGIAHHHVGINFMAGRRPRAKAQVRHHEHTRDDADDLAGLSRCFTWNARRLFCAGLLGRLCGLFRLHQALAALSSLLFLKGAVHFIHAGSSCFFRSSGQGLPCQSFQYTTVCEKKNHNLVTILRDYPASFARFGMRMVKRMPSSVSSRCMSASTPARCISPSEWRMVFKKMRTSLTM